MPQKTKVARPVKNPPSRRKKQANANDFINKQASIIANQDKIIENQDIMLELKNSNLEIQAKIIANQNQIIEGFQTMLTKIEKSKTVFLIKTKAKKGDVEFFEDENNRKYQRVLKRYIYPVEVYKNNYKFIQKVNEIDIMYHTNGMAGFVLVANKKIIKVNIWSLAYAIKLAQKSKQ
jgi:hypothetical protein